jgi:hypothetical protein
MKVKQIFWVAVLLVGCWFSACDAAGTDETDSHPELEGVPADETDSHPGLEGVPADEVAYLEDASLLSLDTAKNALYFSLLERYIVLEINRCRANPIAWTQEVGLYGGEVQQWADGLGAGYSLPPLEPRKGLWLSGRFQSSEMKRINTMTHANMNSRFSRYGNWSGGIGENVGPPGIEQQATGPAWFSSGGLGNARKYGARIVNEFIRDRGNPDKGHRRNIMNPSFRYIGVGVIDGWITMEFAEGYTDKPEAGETDVWLE